MKLEHLKKTLETCIGYFEYRDRPTKVKQLEEKLEHIKNNSIIFDLVEDGTLIKKQEETASIFFNK